MGWALIACPANARQHAATPSTLNETLAKARDADVIRLAPGVYPGLVAKFRTFSPPLTITSADPANPAILVGMLFNALDGVTFRDVVISPAGMTSGLTAMKSRNLTFDHVSVHGTLDGDAGNDGAGLIIQTGSNITISNSEFVELRQGAGITDGVNINVAGNAVRKMMKSGFVFAGVSNVRVIGNTISDVRPILGQHPDAIQFFTTGTTAAAHDIVVSDNVIQRGDGEPMQGIFFRDQVGTLPYERVVIANNLIVGTGYGGILVMGAKDLEITGNELVSNPGKGNTTWILVQNAERVRSIDNKAVSISYDKVTGLSENGDVIVPAVRDLGLAATRAWTAKRAAGRPANR